MKILYDNNSLDRIPPSSIEEDAAEVYCGGIVGALFLFVPLITLIVGTFMLPFIILGSVFAVNNHDTDGDD